MDTALQCVLEGSSRSSKLRLQHLLEDYEATISSRIASLEGLAAKEKALKASLPLTFTATSIPCTGEGMEEPAGNIFSSARNQIRMVFHNERHNHWIRGNSCGSDNQSIFSVDSQRVQREVSLGDEKKVVCELLSTWELFEKNNFEGLLQNSVKQQAESVSILERKFEICSCAECLDFAIKHLEATVSKLLNDSLPLQDAVGIERQTYIRLGLRELELLESVQCSESKLRSRFGRKNLDLAELLGDGSTISSAFSNSDQFTRTTSTLHALEQWNTFSENQIENLSTIRRLSKIIFFLCDC